MYKKKKSGIIGIVVTVIILILLVILSNIKIENNKNIKLAIFIYCINISVSVNTAYILKNIKYIVIIDAYTKLFNTFPVTKSFIFFTILFFSFESFSNFLSSFLFVYMPFYHFFLDLSSVFIMFSLK